jgi:hypothetical protein
MEPTQETQTTESPKPAPAPKGRARCQARNRAGGQCRMHVQPPSGRLCARHAGHDAETISAHDDSLDLWDDIFADEESVLTDAENINKALSNVVALVAKGRISSRRAAAVSYALSLILRTVVIMDRQADDEPPRVFWSDPRPEQNDPQPAAAPQPPANTSPEPASTTKPIAEPTPAQRFEAAQRYARLRT